MRNVLLLFRCAAVLAVLSVCHAAPFQNLNFDSANTNTIFESSPGSGLYVGPTTDLLPGWSLSSTRGLQLVVGYNSVVPDAAFPTLFSPAYIGHVPVVGLYSFTLSTIGQPGSFIPFTLSQSGDLPAGVRSIHFLNLFAPFELYVNGSPISLTYTQVPNQPDWNFDAKVFDAAGDISPFAGQTVELKFTTLQSPTGDNGIDEIYFSTIGIPEPSTLLLFCLGGFPFFWRRLRRR